METRGGCGKSALPQRGGLGGSKCPCSGCHSAVLRLMFPKRNISFSICPPWKLCQSSTFSPQRKNSSASSLQHCESENCVIHSSLLCFDTFRIFPQRSKFSLGAGGEPQSPWYPKHTAFLSQLLGNTQGSSAASIAGIYKHEESLNRKLQTVARVFFLSHLVISEALMKSHVITTFLYTDSATLVHLQTQVSQLHHYNGTCINGFKSVFATNRRQFFC